MTSKASDLSEGRKQVLDVVKSGAALLRFQAMMEAQGVAKKTAETLCSAHTDYFSVLRKSEHQTELMTLADGTKTQKRRFGFKQYLMYNNGTFF